MYLQDRGPQIPAQRDFAAPRPLCRHCLQQVVVLASQFGLAQSIVENSTAGRNQSKRLEQTRKVDRSARRELPASFCAYTASEWDWHRHSHGQLQDGEPERAERHRKGPNGSGTPQVHSRRHESQRILVRRRRGDRHHPERVPPLARGARALLRGHHCPAPVVPPHLRERRAGRRHLSDHGQWRPRRAWRAELYPGQGVLGQGRRHGGVPTGRGGGLQGVSPGAHSGLHSDAEHRIAARAGEVRVPTRGVAAELRELAGYHCGCFHLWHLPEHLCSHRRHLT